MKRKNYTDRDEQSVQKVTQLFGSIAPIFQSFLVLAFSATFLLNKVGLQNIQGKEMNQKIDLSGIPPLYRTKEKVDFNSGNHVIAFLSVHCSHCKSVAHKLAYLNQKQKATNLHLIISSKHEEDIQPFMDETRLDLPFVWINDNSFFNTVVVDYQLL